MTVITAVHADLTTQRVDAIVNAANERLRGGGGVDGAIHRAGGPEVLADCIARFPNGLATGDAGWTTAGRLPARWVIHTVAPDRNAGDERWNVLADAYRRSLEVAGALQARTVAFPLLGAGAFGWSKADSLRAAFDAVRAVTSADASGAGVGSIEEVRIVAFDASGYRLALATTPDDFAPPADPGTVGALMAGLGVSGLRGDPFLWNAIHRHFARVPLPADRASLRTLAENALIELTGHPLGTGQEIAPVREFAGGGMSSGMVRLQAWEEEFIPSLLARFDAL